MKKFLKSLVLFAAAAMALTSCENEAINEGIEANDTYTMTFTAGAPESRTSVAIDGTTATYSWSEGDRVAFIQSAVGVEKTNKKNSNAAVITDGVATFTTAFDAVDGATAYNYGAYYPTQEPNSDKTFDNVIISLAANQDLTKDTFAPAADLLMSKPIEGKAINAHGGNLQFTRLAAIGKMTLKGVTAGESIKNVVITFENEVVNGNVTLNFDAVTATYAETGSNTVTLGNGALTALAEGTPIFFTCFPGEYTGAYSVEVTTDKATYTTNAGKSISESKPLTFSAGDVTAFNLTVDNRTEPDESGEVTIVASEQGLTSGSAIQTLTAAPITVTFAQGSNSNAPKYYSTSNPAAFRVYGGNTFTVSSEKTILSIVLTFASGEGTNAISTDVDSYSDGTWTGSANSVTFTVGGTTGHRRIAQMVITYGKPDTRTTLDTPEVTATAEGKNVTVSWDAVENAGSYTLTYGETVVENAESPYEFEGEYSTTYEFSVVAIPSNDTTHKNSVAGTAEVTTIANPATPGEGDGSAEAPFDVTRALYYINNSLHNENTEVYVKGIVSTAPTSINATYGSATYYISVDGTTTAQLMVYGGLFFEKTKFTSTDQIKVEDEVHICGKLKDYNGTPEFNTNSWIVKLVRDGEEVKYQAISFDKTSVTITEGDEFTAPTLSGAQTTVEYTSSNTAVATVNENTGAVTLVGVGETTITATAAAENGYIEATASYTITVNEAGGEGAETITADPANIADNSTYGSYSNTDWIMTCGSNNGAFGCNSSGSATKMKLGDNYTVALPLDNSITSSSTKYAAIISKRALSGIGKVVLAGTPKSGITVGITRSTDGTTWEKVADFTATSTTTFTFDAKTAYYAVVIKATNADARWQSFTATFSGN